MSGRKPKVLCLADLTFSPKTKEMLEAETGLVVIEEEWRDDLECHPLIRYAGSNDNLIITPHVGGITWEAQDKALQFTTGKLLRALHAEPASGATSERKT